MVHTHASGSGKSTDSHRRGKCFVEKTCHRGGQGESSEKWPFQPSVSSAEMVGRLETHHRFFLSEQVCHMSSFQNGDIRRYQTIS